MFKTVFLIAVAVTGFVEWLKGLLPAKFKSSKFGLPILSGIISAITGAGFVLLAKPLFGLSIELSLVNFLIYILGTVGTVQISYNILLQTFKAIVTKLKNKYTSTEIDSDEISDKVVETIDSKIMETISKAAKEAIKD